MFSVDTTYFNIGHESQDVAMNDQSSWEEPTLQMPRCSNGITPYPATEKLSITPSANSWQDSKLRKTCVEGSASKTLA